jgi:hypothetical protein
MPDSVSVTRSPTGSIQTILTIESDASHEQWLSINKLYEEENEKL